MISTQNLESAEIAAGIALVSGLVALVFNWGRRLTLRKIDSLPIGWGSKSFWEAREFSNLYSFVRYSPVLIVGALVAAAMFAIMAALALFGFAVHHT